MRRVAKEMDVEKATAAWVIRDVTIGRDCEFSPACFGSDGAIASETPLEDLVEILSMVRVCVTDSFLMDAFDPKYLYW